ncbi:MAG: hypothetical protein IKY75_07630 [Bacteroidaceae bacterium]|nr:hypothetical protein [Bacteroidaceae bacterium]
MESTLFTRLDAFMQCKGLNDNRITVQAKIAVGTIGKQRRSGKGLSYDSIVKILRTYPELNPTWFILGEGEMFLNDKKHSNNIEELLRTIKAQEATIAKQEERLNLLVNQLDYLRTQLSVNQEYLREILDKING